MVLEEFLQNGSRAILVTVRNMNNNSYKSCIKNVTCGVPQGSILGPLLFVFYVDDIINTSTILNFVLFADDTTILYFHKDLANKLVMIKNELQKKKKKKNTDWFKANKISINIDKTL